MLFKQILRDLARWMLLGFGLFTIAIVIVLMIHVGWFGPTAALHAFWDQLAKFYAQHKTAIDRAAGIIGVGGSFVAAVLAIHRSWYYAEWNFPKRLKEWIDRAIDAHLNVRSQLLATVNDAVAPTGFLVPVVYTGYFDSAMRRVGLGGRRRRARLLKSSLEDLKDDLDIVETRRRQIEAQTVTAYLLRGAEKAGKAALARDNADALRENNAALTEFMEALKIKKDDVDALELTAKQYLVLGDNPHALDYLEQMTTAAASDPLRKARALRLRAEIREKENTGAALDAARGLLIAAIDEVLLPVRQTGPERTLELAKAYRVRGEVQLKRERFTAAETALLEAKERFARVLRAARNGRGGKLGLFGSAADEGLKSTEDALRRLAQAKKDKEAPGE